MKSGVLLALSFFAMSVFGQNKGTTQLWQELTFQKNFNKKWTTELGGRLITQSAPGELKAYQYGQQIHIRSTTHYAINSHWRVSTILGWWDNLDIPAVGRVGTDEFRVIPQVQYQFPLGVFNISIQNRFEFRGLERTDHYEAAYRSRHQARFTYSIGESVGNRPSKSITGYYELFRTVGRVWATDQNRFYLGYNQRITTHLGAEAAYMALERASSWNHVLWVRILLIDLF